MYVTLINDLGRLRSCMFLIFERGSRNYGRERFVERCILNSITVFGKFQSLVKFFCTVNILNCTTYKTIFSTLSLRSLKSKKRASQATFKHSRREILVREEKILNYIIMRTNSCTIFFAKRKISQKSGSCFCSRNP